MRGCAAARTFAGGVEADPDALRWDVIDTHCHLTFPEFAGKTDATLAEAAEHGVTGCITIATTTPDAEACLRVAGAHPRVWCSAGVHPLYAAEGPHDWAQLERVARAERCVAFGELGLDNHYSDPPREVQHAVLGEQLAVIERLVDTGVHKPVIIHCREAFADLIPVLKRTRLQPGRFVFHCFTGSPADMRLVLDFGAWVSFTGVVTYRNAAEVREAVKLVPAERIMVETDAPFLAPEPRRSERPCKPWMVSLTAQKLADVRGVEFAAFHERLNENTAAFFGIR